MPPDAIVLAFDTAAAHCAAAVISGDRVLAQRVEPMEKGQADRLMPLLAEVLAEAGHSYCGLGALAVGTGPGNFTGLRIAVSAARGLALGLSIPAIGVTGFEALRLDLPPDVVTLLDARQGALWLAGGDLAPQRLERAAADGAWAGRPFVGHRAAEMAALNGGTVLVQPVPVAVAIARIAATRLGSSQPRPAPFYLRAPDAALPAEPPLLILP